MKLNKTTLLFTLIGLAAMFVSERLSKSRQSVVWLNETEDKEISCAFSKDGLYWETLDKSIPAFKSLDDAYLMRSPSIARDMKDGFHRISICEKQTEAFCYSHSNDLINWDKVKRIPAFDNQDSIIYVLDPKMIYDDSKKEWLIYWASTNAERHDKLNKNHKIYAVSTSDFKTFSEPFVVFASAHKALKATIVKYNNGFVMFFLNKNHLSHQKQLRYASAKSINGPWEINPEILSESCTEEPIALAIDNSIF